MSIPCWFTLLLIILVQLAGEIEAVHGKEPADSSSNHHRPSTSSSSAHEHAEHITQQQQQGGQATAGHDDQRLDLLLTPGQIQSAAEPSSASAAVFNWRKIAERIHAAGVASHHRLTEPDTSNQINQSANASDADADWQFRHAVEQYHAGAASCQHYATGHSAAQTQVNFNRANISRQMAQQQHTKDHRPSGAEAGQSPPASGNYRRVLSLDTEANRQEKAHREPHRMQTYNLIMERISPEDLASIQIKASALARENYERMIGVAPAAATASRQQPIIANFEQNDAAIQERASAIAHQANDQRMGTADVPAASLLSSNHHSEEQILRENYPSTTQKRANALAHNQINHERIGITTAAAHHSSRSLIGHPFGENDPASNVSMPTLLKLFTEKIATGHQPPAFAPHQDDQLSSSSSFAAEEGTASVPTPTLLNLFPTGQKATGHQPPAFAPGDKPSLHIAEPDPTTLGGADHGTSLQLAAASIREQGQQMPENLSRYHHLLSAGVGEPSENPSTSKLVELKLFPKQTRERENAESSAAKRSRKD